MQTIHGLPIAASLEEACYPRRLALLIYDMQVGICQQVSCGPAITEACKRLRDRCRAAGVPVAYSRHLSLPIQWMGAFQTRMAMAWQRVDDPAAVKPWFLRGTPGFELVAELAPTDDEFVFDKLAMSAFEGTPLQFALRDCGITTLAISDASWASRSRERSPLK
jgi:biuret amidohydrolase